MIFVTVGHQMPFDRLIRLVDCWAEGQRGTDLFGQIGQAEYIPKNFSWVRWLSPADYERSIQSASAIVAHAGTGTILQALVQHKPLLVLPRLAMMGETRSDHQIGTARHFGQRGQIMAAFDDASFLAHLNCLREFRPRSRFDDGASPELLSRIRHFVEGGRSAQMTRPISNRAKKPMIRK